MVPPGELIDTLWNVNKAALIESPVQKYELIDTLWNVNKMKKIQVIADYFELIDTLWNVNLMDGKTDEEFLRINRYIMECKLSTHNAVEPLARINRYIMECKYKWTEQELQKLEELIDTLWNVNTLATPAPKRSGCELIDTLWNVNWRKMA